MFFIYILYSESSDVFYIGHTDDWNRRFREHNESPHTTYTSKHRPWTLMAVFQCGDERRLALEIERFIRSRNQEQ